MTALSSLSDFIAKASGSAIERIEWQVVPRIGGAAGTTCIAGRPQSYWTFDGTRPGPGTVPTTVVAPDNTFAGSMKQSDATGGRQKLLTGFAARPGQNMGGNVILYDRLLHIGGLSGTVTTAQAVGGALTRNTGGLGNRIFVEIYTQIGATPTTITASYTNQSGNGKTTGAIAFGGTNDREATRFIELPLAAGDTGVQAVASVTVLGTTGTAGNFGVTVVRPLATIHAPSNSCGGAVFGRGLLSKNLPPVVIDAGACLSLYAHHNTALIPDWMGYAFMVES